MPHAGTPYVEAVAVMAKYNPFFEKVGMQKIAESKPNTTITEALASLEELGFDAMLMGSAAYNYRIIQQTGTQAIIAILTELSEHNGGIRRRLISTKAPSPSLRNSPKKSPQARQLSLQKP